MLSTLRRNRFLVTLLALGLWRGPSLAQTKLPPKKTPDTPVKSSVEGSPILVTDPGGHTAMVKACFFAPDGETVFTVASDKTVRVWEVRTGDLLQTFRLPMGAGIEGALFAGAISPDGKWIAVGGSPFGQGKFGVMIYLINRQDGRVAGVLKGHKDIIASLAFTKNSKQLVSASADGNALLFDLATGSVVRAFQGHTDRVRKVALSPDDKWVATTSSDRSFRIWNLATGKSVARIENPAETLSVAFSPVEPLLATGCLDGTIQIWKTDGSPIRSFKVDPELAIQFVSIQFSPDGKELLYTGVSRGGHAGIVDVGTGKHRIVFPNHSNTVLDGQFSKDGTLAVTTGGDDHETYIWRPADGSVVQKIQGGGKSVWGVGWRLDGKAIGWGNTNGGNTVTATTKLERSFLLDDLEFGLAPNSPEAKGQGQNFGRVALRLGPWALQPVNFTSFDILKNGERIHTFKCNDTDRIYAISQLPGDRALVGTGSFLYLVDLQTNKIVRTYTGHAGIVLGISPSPDGRHFLTGSLDQTISLWDPDKNDPLVSLFFADRDWIAWMPQGYYACSPQGERLMGWQINNGADKAASFHPAARFRASLYNPELIRAIFREKNLEKAFDVVRKKSKTPALETTTVAKVLPPVVNIITPTAATSSVKQAEIQVKAKAKSSGDQPVTALRLLVDGRPYRGKESLKPITGPKLGEVEVAWTVDLLPGKHQLAVMAESAVSKGMSPIVEVTRTGAAKDELPTLYVLAVGVSDYPGELKLNFAHRDAVVLEKTLKDCTQGAFKSVESTLLINDRATRKEILQGLDWLAKKMTARDVAIVFFAGHGDRDSKGQFHFLPVDVDIDRMGETCILGDLLKDRIANLPGRVVAMLDACHSGAATTAVTKKALADDLVRDLVSEDLGVVVMCSSQGSEFSLESPDTKHGYFTLGIVEALGGKADFNKDRYVYLHEIDMYAYARVRSLSRGVQNPTTGRSPQIRSFPLASVGKQ